MEKITVNCIREASQAEGLAGEWRALESCASLPTQSFDFFKAALATFVTEDELCVVAARDGDRLVGVLPLCRARGALAPWRIVGTSELYEPNDALAADAAAADQLAAAVAGLPAPAVLERVPVDSPLIPALRKAFKGRLVVRPDSFSPTLPLDARWQEPESCFNSGRRSDFRRAQRHAEKFGAVGLDVLTPAPEEVDALMDEAIAIELASWKKEAGTALGMLPAKASFFKTYARLASERGALRLAFMRIDGTPMAMQIAFVFANRYWLFKIGHNDAFSKCSPGTLMMLATLKHAATDGLVAYEMLGNDEPWIAMWTREQKAYVQVRTYPANVAGLAASARDGALRFYEKVKYRLEKRWASKPD